MSFLGGRNLEKAYMENSREIIEEFLIESNEGLAQLDRNFVELEKRPDDRELLSSAFRTIHTIKGVSGFLGFAVLEGVTHHAESILTQLRDGKRLLTPELTDLLLEAFDNVREILAEIEGSSGEGEDERRSLIERLEAACESSAAAVEPTDADAAPAATDAAETKKTTGATETTDMTDAAETQSPAARAAEIAPAEGVAGRPSIADSNIRVSVGVLDDLMNLVGELVLARNQILQVADGQADAGFMAAAQRLNLITTELQAKVMKTRMQPIRVVWNKFPRIVRDLGGAFGKQIELAMEGADTELDKTVIEAIKDPLTHIVRNSCDHGIESSSDREARGKPQKGTLLLRAYHEGGQVNIEISDDGAGVDPERVKRKAVAQGLITAEQGDRLSEKEMTDLVFMPGFSTAAEVTNVSGRGVGMDVVRTNIEKIGGSADLQSRRGSGTTIKIKIPLTLAIIPALTVTCSAERFAIPQVNLLELVRVEPGLQNGQIETIHGAPVYRLRGKLLPLVYLHDALSLERPEREADEPINIVVLQADERSFGLVVDAVHDTAEIVVKPLSKLLKGQNCYAGATVMGDGNVALILDVLGVAHIGGVVRESQSETAQTHPAFAESQQELQKVLLFRAGSEQGLAAKLSLVDRLEEFPLERIEIAGRRQVVQYRGGILPLIDLGESLGGEAAAAAAAETAQVIVFSQGERRIGVRVECILDIVEESIAVRTRTARPGLLGSAVIAGRVTDFIDLRHLFELVERETQGGATSDLEKVSALLVGPPSFALSLLRAELEMAGCRVREAAGAAEALEGLGVAPAQVLLCALPAPEAQDLLERLRETPELGRVRAIALSERPTVGRETNGSSGAATAVRFDAYESGADRQAVLASIERLTAALDAFRIPEETVR